MEARIEGHAADAPSKKPPQLTLWPLVAMIFFEVCGGPFGTEVRFFWQPDPVHV